MMYFLMVWIFSGKITEPAGDGNSHVLPLDLYWIICRLGSEISDSMVILGLFYYHSSLTCTT